MSLYTIPTLFTAVLSLFLGLFVLSKNRKSILNRSFALWCFLTSYWQGVWTVLFNLQDAHVAETVARLGYSGILFIPVAFFHFVVEFTQNETKRKLSYLFYILGGIFLISLWTSDAIVEGVYHYYWGFYPRAGFLHVFYLAALCLMLFTGLYLLLDYRGKVFGQPVKVNQASYVFVSTVIYSLAGTDFLINYGFEFYPPGFIFTNVHAGVIAYAIIQYRLLEINVFVRKSLGYAFLLMALLLPCYLLVMFGQKMAFGNINYSFSLFTLFLLVVVGFMFPKLRFRTEGALEQVLFKKRYDYRETLLRSSRDMISVVDLETLSNNLVQTVSKALGIEKTSLFLSDEIKGSFPAKANVGFGQERFRECVLLRDDPLVRRFRMTPEALVREELEMVHNGPEPRDLALRMGEIEAEVSLPLISKERLIGILNLGHKEGKVMYSNEDLEVLSTLANQAAIAIDNAVLYEDVKQSQRIIHRANRLSSLGMLTAGLAHEIRNPLVAIRTFTQLLPERYEDAEFRDSFKALTLKEVDRICGLVNDLLNFARPSAPKVSREDVSEIVKSIVRILETEAKEKGVTIDLHVASSLPKIFVDKEQIKQVSMNVILNAIQSIQDDGMVGVSTRLFVKDSREHFVQIEVRDTGVGIPERDLENIFNPFFTTKEDGSGLGLSISHQIVREHGGYMVVESKAGLGTTFYINLPASQVNYRRVKARPQVHEKDFGR